MRADGASVEAGEHRRPDPAVIKLDAIAGADAAAADEVRDAEQAGDLGEGGGVERDRAGGDLVRDRRARHAEQFDELARRRVEGGDPAPQRVLERERAGDGGRGAGGRRFEDGVANELVDEDRVTIGFARDLVDVEGEPRRGHIEESTRERARLEAREAGERDLEVTAESGADGGAGGSSAPARRELPVGDAGRAEEQERRRGGRTQDVAEQGEAVGVGPLEVVDEDDDGTALGEAGEHVADRGEHSAPHLVRVGPLRGVARLGHPRDAAQGGKDLHERTGPGREIRVGFARRDPREEAAEGIDDSVERLVGDGLALVAAAGEDDRAPVVAHDRVGEVADEPALAEPGLAADEHRDRLRARASAGRRR